MALKLNKGKPKAQPIAIGGGVVLHVRPATYTEAAEAGERITPMIIALREGNAAAIDLTALLGDEFAGVAFDDAKLSAAAQKLALMELVALCCERVEGTLLGDDDVPVAEIDAAVAGTLIRDPIIARRLRDVIEGPLHEIVAEKKELAASLNGAAAAPDIAPDAARPAPPAQ